MNNLIILTHNFLPTTASNKLLLLQSQLKENNKDNCTLIQLDCRLDNEFQSVIIKDNQVLEVLNSCASTVIAHDDNISTMIMAQIAVLTNMAVITNVINFKSINEVTVSKYNNKVYTELINKNYHKLYLTDIINYSNINKCDSINHGLSNESAVVTYQISTAYDESCVGCDCDSGNVSKQNNSNQIQQNLQTADKVIAGGIALINADNFNSLIVALAKALNAEYAGSLIAAEQKLVTFQRHIGQTGLSLAPNWYIAIGISGAPQHMLGITQAKNIIAINKDSNATIFKYANYGIVADLFILLPKLLADLTKK